MHYDGSGNVVECPGFSNVSLYDEYGYGERTDSDAPGVWNEFLKEDIE